MDKSKKLIYLEKILRFMAVAVLRRHKPKIVAITGSVGKTSSKTAVFAVLSAQFNVRQNQKNYNNEIGIPLTIIGTETGGSNLFYWLWVFLKWIFVLIFPAYPEILVLELGVDRPDDMKYFMSFIQPTVSIVTNVSYSHMEYFKNIENIAKEKRVIIEALKMDGTAILNADDALTLEMKDHTKAKIITFGQALDAEVNASNLVYNYLGGRPEGISFKLNFDGKNVPIRLPNLLAAHYVYAVLSAIAVGTIFKMNLIEIANALEPLKSPPGRLNMIEGVKGARILDDTYNASPMSVLGALEVLNDLKFNRKIAVLGDMLELGDQNESGHKQVGRRVAEIRPAFFVAIGKRMQIAVKEAVSSGFPSQNILQFESPETAKEKIAQLLQAGDLILVKGSQGMRMEKIVEEIIEYKDSAENLLCRQSEEWKKKPFIQP